jgi:hypothetical protein
MYVDILVLVPCWPPTAMPAAAGRASPATAKIFNCAAQTQPSQTLGLITTMMTAACSNGPGTNCNYLLVLETLVFDEIKEVFEIIICHGQSFTTPVSRLLRVKC